MADQDPSTEIAVVEQSFATALASQQSRAVFLPANLAQAMQLAEYMASGIGVRQWMRGNPSACLALIQISMRWGMDPYIVSNKAYYANDTLSFESQLVNAVINTSGALIGRLKVEFSGDAKGGPGKETLNCRVTGRLHADPDQVFVHEQALHSVKIRNSPLWQVNPRQQLQYHATRAWARLYMPEVLLGIYTPDEIADGEAMRIQAISEQRTPEAKAPDRRDFTRETDERAHNGGYTVDEEAQFEEIETHLPEEEVVTGDGTGEPLPEVQPEEEQTERAAGPETAPAVSAEKHILDTIPATADRWNAWDDAVGDALNQLSTRQEFDTLRRRIAGALGKAPEALMTDVQDKLTDKLLELPEEEK